MERRLNERPSTRLTPVSPPPKLHGTRYLFEVKCTVKGRTCDFHGKRVKADSHKEALAQVVYPKRFGPLHRVKRHLPEFIATPKPETLERHDGLPPNRGHMDVRHGPIYVRKVGDYGPE
jgi:hypothetical protein